MKIPKELKSLLIIFFLVTSLQSVTSQDISKKILYVGGSGEGNFTSIHEAVAAAKDGYTIFVYSGTYRENNITIDKSIKLVGENKETTIVDGRKKGNVIHVIADRVQIESLTIKNSGYVIETETLPGKHGTTVPAGGIEKANKTSILEINISTAGILVEACSVNVSNCIVEDCQFGIVLRKSRDCSVEDTQVKTKTLPKSIGIGIYGSENIRVSGCNVSSCSIGINIMYSRSLEAYNNKLFRNMNVGISLQLSSNCTVHHNSIIGSRTGVGVRGDCKNITIYSNNFLENEISAIDYCNVSWDNGIVGNYWDDYNGTDANGDGIGDQPYTIPGLWIAKDNHPLMEKAKSPSPITVNITFPKDGSAIYGVIEVTGTATCKEGIREVDVRIDNSSWIKANGTTEWSVKINFTKYGKGKHVLEARAISEDGREASAEITIDIKAKSSTPGFGITFLFVAILLLVLFQYMRRRR